MGAHFGIGFIVFLFMLPGIGLVAGGFALLAAVPALGVALITIGVIVFLVVSLISSAVTAISQAAVYLYGANGETPEGFETDSLGAAFAPR